MNKYMIMRDIIKNLNDMNKKMVIKNLAIPKKCKIIIAPEGESYILAYKTFKYFNKHGR